MALIFVAGITIGSSSHVVAQQASIPGWVKKTALWWGQGQISDDEFIKALQWMINEGILSVPGSSPSPTTPSNTPATTAPASTLSPLMPQGSDLDSFWNILGTTSSSRFDVLQQATPPDVPAHTVEQTLEKTTVTPTTYLTIDMASFQVAGMSTTDEATATRAYFYLLSDYQNTHSGYKQSVFTPTPSDSRAVCSIYTITTTESTKTDLFCVKGFAVFVIDASGNDVSMSDDVKKMANLILPKLTAF